MDGSTFTVVFGRRPEPLVKPRPRNSVLPRQPGNNTDALIAEKSKKGYIEVGVNGHSGAVSVAAPAKVAERPLKVSAPAPTPPPEPIVLDSSDWAYATWRPRSVQPRPAAPAFTLEDGLKRLERVIGSQRWRFSWDDARMPAAMTREEARFWVEAMARSHRNRFHDYPQKTYDATGARGNGHNP